MPSLFEYIHQKRKIKKSPLPEHIRHEILNEYSRLTFKKSFMSREAQTTPGITRLLSFNIHHLGFKTLFHLFNEIFVDGDYSVKYDTDTPFIIDCGANMGMSMMFQKTLYPEAEILCFEPDEKTFDILVKNIKENILNNVTVFKQAVSDHDGEITFYFDEENEGSLQMSVIKDRSPENSCTVEATRLSKHINKNVDLLKLDIEGAELSVLQELDSSNKYSLIKRIFIEYHHHIQAEVDNLSLTLEILERNGYRYQIYADHLRPIPEGTMQDVMIYAYKKNLKHI